jgi:NADH-quinone oxidoreductase subunit H
MRYDQLMRLGWKGMLPASIVNVVITAGIIWLTQPVAK